MYKGVIDPSPISLSVLTFTPYDQKKGVIGLRSQNIRKSHEFF